MRKVLVIIVLFAVFVQTKAQVVDDAFKAEVAKTIKLQRMDKLFSEGLRVQIKTLVDQGKIKPENQNRLITDLTQSFMPLIVRKLEKIIVKNYTLEELKTDEFLSCFTCGPKRNTSNVSVFRRSRENDEIRTCSTQNGGDTSSLLSTIIVLLPCLML